MRFLSLLVSVIQTVENTIKSLIIGLGSIVLMQSIMIYSMANHHQVDNIIGFGSSYPMDTGSEAEWRYQSLEQLGVRELKCFGGGVCLFSLHQINFYPRRFQGD